MCCLGEAYTVVAECAWGNTLCIWFVVGYGRYQRGITLGIKGVMKKLGEVPSVISYESELKSMKGQYSEWLFWQEQDQKMKEDAGGAALEGAHESYFGSRPLRAVQTYFLDHPNTLILYGDEDAKGKDGKPADPWFRPIWSPERLESCFYFGSLIAIRKTFLEEGMPDWQQVLGPFEMKSEQTSGKEKEDSGAKVMSGPAIIFVNEAPDETYRTAIFSLCERAGGWKKGCKSISHLAGILYHCSSKEKLAAFADPFSGYRRMETYLKASISAIILTKDHPELLEKCVEGLHTACSGKEPIFHEVIVVDNGSSRENREKLEKLPGITYLYEPMEFNFSKLCNIGAKHAKSEILLFLNDDVELRMESHLEQMIRLAQRPGVGSVGLKLYYPNSTKIQHVGVTNLPTGPVHKLLYLEDEPDYYFGRNRGWHNVLAVSAACVMMRAAVFWEAGGFEESLSVAYNDVALGFKLYELGYRNVCACNSFAYHHESMTRGSDEDEKKKIRLMAEQERLYKLFPAFAGKDPYYSPYLGRLAVDTQIRPAYETSKNACQTMFPKPFEEVSGFRMDPCLNMVVEEQRGNEMTGYVIVLGDDNACYDRFIVFEKDSGQRYGETLNEQYRPDLVEKMPDQMHVALSGFWLHLEEGALPPGNYRVGCFATRKVGNLKLFYWSKHILRII